MPRIDLNAIAAAVAAKTGAADPSAVGILRPGAVFEVKDDLIDFPGKPEQLRTWHDMRRVIVIQAYHLLGPVEPDTVTVVPCSASQHGARRGDFQIPNGEPGFTKPNVVAYTTLVMPVPKVSLTADGSRGVISDETYGALLATLARNLGIRPCPTCGIPT